jgi:hypothetical protein
MLQYLLPRPSDERLDWPDEPPILTSADLREHTLFQWFDSTFTRRDRAERRVRDRFFELMVAQVRKFRPLDFGFGLHYYLKEMSLAAQAELWNKALDSAGYDVGDAI